MSKAFNRGIIYAALLSMGYEPNQAETRIIQFENDIRYEERTRIRNEIGLDTGWETRFNAGNINPFDLDSILNGN